MVTPSMTASSAGNPMLWVYCLCAQWCGTCREYQPLFDRLAAEMPQAQFVWVDVEEHDALLGDLDIENFPTLLLVDAQRRPCFAGTVLPHADTLQRMCQAALQDDFAPIADATWQAVANGLFAAQIG